MVATNFDRALKRVLQYERGYSNHPDDPGGATMRGVIQRVYDAFREKEGLPLRSVKYLTDAELRKIYREQYWNKIRGDDLPHGVDFVVFDGAVNSGPVQSTKWLQRALDIPADGDIGQVTVNAARNEDPDDLIDDICDQRLAFLKRLKTWPTFGKGWASRVSDVRSTGKLWAGSTADPKPLPAPPTGGKAPAPVEKEKPAVKSWINWAAVGAFLSSVGGFLTDWRVVAVIITGLLVAWIISMRSGKPDIRGWFK